MHELALLQAASAARAQAVTLGVPDAVLGAFIGAAVSQLGAFGILYLTLGHQAQRAREEREFQERRERDADRRSLRDARRERLRKAYAEFITASLAAGRVVHESAFVLEGETVETRDARLGRMLADAFKDINRAQVELMMEAEGREVLDTFQNVVYDGYIHYRTGLAANAERPGTVRLEELNFHRDRLKEGTDALIKSARTRLEFLEQALPGE